MCCNIFSRSLDPAQFGVKRVHGARLSSTFSLFLSFFSLSPSLSLSCFLACCMFRSCGSILAFCENRKIKHTTDRGVLNNLWNGTIFNHQILLFLDFTVTLHKPTSILGESTKHIYIGRNNVNIKWLFLHKIWTHKNLLWKDYFFNRRNFIYKRIKMWCLSVRLNLNSYTKMKINISSGCRVNYDLYKHRTQMNIT